VCGVIYRIICWRNNMKEKPFMVDAGGGVLTKEAFEKFVSEIISKGGIPTPSIPLPNGYTYAEYERWLANKLGVTK